MTELFFVRHARVLYTHDDRTRPLSKQGQASVPLVTEAFKSIHLDGIVSSPYDRVLDTIQGVASDKGLKIEQYDDLRERKVAHEFIDDFQTFTNKQWSDFDYHLDGGESLREVQDRGIRVLKSILDKYEGKSIMVGTHGTFLAVQLKYFRPELGFDFWRQIRMPDIYKATFDGHSMIQLERLEIGGSAHDKNSQVS